MGKTKQNKKKKKTPKKEGVSNYLEFSSLLQVLEFICTRESGSVFDAGGLNCVLTFIREHGSQVHKDTLHSAMSVVSRLCGKMEPQDSSLESCVESLSTLLKHEDQFVSPENCCLWTPCCLSKRTPFVSRVTATLTNL